MTCRFELDMDLVQRKEVSYLARHWTDKGFTDRLTKLPTVPRDNAVGGLPVAPFRLEAVNHCSTRGPL